MVKFAGYQYVAMSEAKGRGEKKRRGEERSGMR
jgi:hypothetical protein